MRSCCNTTLSRTNLTQCLFFVKFVLIVSIFIGIQLTYRSINKLAPVVQGWWRGAITGFVPFLSTNFTDKFWSFSGYSRWDLWKVHRRGAEPGTITDNLFGKQSGYHIVTPASVHNYFLGTKIFPFAWQYSLSQTFNETEVNLMKKTLTTCSDICPRSVFCFTLTNQI